MSSLDSQNPLPNQTGAEMLERLHVFDEHIAIVGLTPDATEALQGARDQLHARLVSGAEYAAAIAIATGITFPNPFEVPDSTVTETGQAEQVELEKPNLWDKQSKEQRIYVEEAKIALSKEFGEVVASGLALIKVENEQDPNDPILMLAYTATDLLDLGDPSKTYDPKRNWDTIMGEGNNNKRMIEINGEQIDLYANQTLATLSAIANANPEISEWVWRTGEAELVHQSCAPIASVFVGWANDRQKDGAFDYVGIGFRPAVVIPK